MSNTVITPNLSAHAMRALVLKAIPFTVFRHHGIGVLQGYLAESAEPEVRIHIWSRRLLKPGMDVSGDVHDHRFDMVSHVLCGSIEHEEIVPVLDETVGAHRMLLLTHARAAADNNFHGPTEPIDGRYRVQRHRMRIEAGHTYTFPAGHFHRSPLSGGPDDVAVTVVEKHRQRDDVRARILHPAAHPPVMAFGHDMDADLAKTVVDQALAALGGVHNTRP